jgi:hypothetical protein
MKEHNERPRRKASINPTVHATSTDLHPANSTMQQTGKMKHGVNTSASEWPETGLFLVGNRMQSARESRYESYYASQQEKRLSLRCNRWRGGSIFNLSIARRLREPHLIHGKYRPEATLRHIMRRKKMGASDCLTVRC